MKKIMLLAFLMLQFGALILRVQHERRWSINAGGGYMAMTDFSTDVGVFNIGVGSYDSSTMGTV